MAEVLTYEEAKEIYNIIKKNVNRTDEDILDLYNDMIARAIKYANARARLSDDRKRIGDLACYIALFEAIENR